MSAIQTRSSKREGVIYHLTHHTQQSNWDCGLSCIYMILPLDKQIKFMQNISALCPEEFENQSTWTIDLCYILKHYRIPHVYYTKTTGIDPNFAKENFYQDAINKDEARVMERFKNAATDGVTVEATSLSLENLLSHLEKKGPAIILINAAIARCDTCVTFMEVISGFLKKIINLKESYYGHYIVACGLDRVKQIVYYRDPSVVNKICQMTFANFEKAWRAYGTDDDVILINFVT